MNVPDFPTLLESEVPLRALRFLFSPTVPLRWCEFTVFFHNLFSS